MSNRGVEREEIVLLKSKSGLVEIGEILFSGKGGNRPLSTL